MTANHPGKAVIPRVHVPDEVCGPRMLACTPAERAFAYAWVFGGSKSQKEAAIAAGFSNTGDSAKTKGSELMRRPTVQAAIEELSRGLMRTEGPASIREIIRLRDHAADERVRLKAAQDLLDRCGLGAVQQSHVTVEHVDDRETKEIVAAAIEYARHLGDARLAYKLLGDSVPKDVIDAEFVEIAADVSTRSGDMSKQSTPPTPEALAARARENELRREMAALTPEEREQRKARYREHLRAKAKARYSAAQNEIAKAAARGEDIDVTAAIADAEAKFAAAENAIENHIAAQSRFEDAVRSSGDSVRDAGAKIAAAQAGIKDGTEGLEDLFGLVNTKSGREWRLK